jgi:hypothetical protein
MLEMLFQRQTENGYAFDPDNAIQKCRCCEKIYLLKVQYLCH